MGPGSQGQDPSGPPQQVMLEAQEAGPPVGGEGTHSLGDGVHTQLHPVPVFVERVDLHDGGSYWVSGEMLGGVRKACQKVLTSWPGGLTSQEAAVIILITVSWWTGQ